MFERICDNKRQQVELATSAKWPCIIGVSYDSKQQLLQYKNNTVDRCETTRIWCGTVWLEIKGSV